MNNTENGPSARPPYKRKVRNYLLDVGLQLRYTATIVIVAVFLTAGLGFKMYQATRDVSKVILWTSLVDPSSAEELQAQFSNSDRVVLWGIVGFGVVLVFSIGTVGILITHKVAGPLHKIASLFARVRENRMGPAPASLRKGDELQEFYSAFREMHQSLRSRVEEDLRVLTNAVSVLEAAPDASRDRASPIQRTLDELRQLRKRKEESLEGGNSEGDLLKSGGAEPAHEDGDEDEDEDEACWAPDLAGLLALAGLSGADEAQAVEEQPR